MIRALVLASLATGALAQAASGLATCQCLGDALWTTYAPGNSKACSWEWADDDGMCQVPNGLASNFTDYPGTYGESCEKQLEPGHSGCFDLTTVPPTEKILSEQASWCPDRWCYIDPCNCDASDATKSDYFPGALFYSYGTCGDKNTYTATESATNVVGNAECATGDESDAESLKMGLGMLLGVVGTMA